MKGLEIMHIKNVISACILLTLIFMASCSKIENTYDLCEYTENNIKISDIFTDNNAEVFEKKPMPKFPKIENSCVSEDNYPKQTHESKFIKYPKGQVVDYVINDDKVYFVVNYDIYHDYSHTVHVFEYNLVDLSLKDIYEFKSLLQNIKVFYHNNELYISAHELEDENKWISGWRLSSLNLNSKKESVLYSIKDTSEMITTGFKQCGDLFEWLEIPKDKYESRAFTLKYYDTIDKTIKIADDRAYLYGSYGNFTKNDYSRQIINDSKIIDIIRETNSSRTIIKTDYEYIEFLAANDNYFTWINWEKQNDLTNPTVIYFNPKLKEYASVNIGELGKGIDINCDNENIFVHVVRDTITSKSNDDFYENVFLINVKENTCQNITNNFVGSETSLIRINYDCLKRKNGYISFYSSENTNNQNTEYIEKDLYYYKAN